MVTYYLWYIFPCDYFPLELAVLYIFLPPVVCDVRSCVGFHHLVKMLLKFRCLLQSVQYVERKATNLVLQLVPVTHCNNSIRDVIYSVKPVTRAIPKTFENTPGWLLSKTRDRFSFYSHFERTMEEWSFHRHGLAILRQGGWDKIFDAYPFLLNFHQSFVESFLCTS